LPACRNVLASPGANHLQKGVFTNGNGEKTVEKYKKVKEFNKSFRCGTSGSIKYLLNIKINVRVEDPDPTETGTFSPTKYFRIRISYFFKA
jgi:hypothetical protein